MSHEIDVKFLTRGKPNYIIDESDDLKLYCIKCVKKFRCIDCDKITMNKKRRFINKEIKK